MPTAMTPLVLHALARDPARRPSALELAERVSHINPATLLPAQAPTIPPAGVGVGATMGDLGCPAAARGRPRGGRRQPGDRRPG